MSNVAYAEILDAEYGTGMDKAIIVSSGTINIKDIYELDDLTGVTTWRGTNKGLNYGVGTYDPKNSSYINATSFTVNNGAIIIADAWADGTDDRKGVVWVMCTETFTNAGNFNMANLGGSGGTPSQNGVGSGGGGGGEYSCDHIPQGGVGGSSYGTTDISISTWADIYGSGGGGGAPRCEGHYEGAGGGGGGGRNAGVTGDNGFTIIGPGGASGSWGRVGGGAIRIYARIFRNTGTMTVNGQDGTFQGIAGHGGGGGGTIFIKTADGDIGINKLTAKGGIGGWSVPTGIKGGAGSVGRIHVEGRYIGSTNEPAIE